MKKMWLLRLFRDHRWKGCIVRLEIMVLRIGVRDGDTESRGREKSASHAEETKWGSPALQLQVPWTDGRGLVSSWYSWHAPVGVLFVSC